MREQRHQALAKVFVQNFLRVRSCKCKAPLGQACHDCTSAARLMRYASLKILLQMNPQFSDEVENSDEVSFVEFETTKTYTGASWKHEITGSKYRVIFNYEDFKDILEWPSQ